MSEENAQQQQIIDGEEIIVEKGIKINSSKGIVKERINYLLSREEGDSFKTKKENTAKWTFAAKKAGVVIATRNVDSEINRVFVMQLPAKES